MKFRYLGRTGLRVSEFCLGTMMFGSWGNKDPEESTRIVHAALDAGVNFIDTADVYANGESEEIVGRALAGRRDDVILATKFYFPMGEDENRRGTSRRWIFKAVEDSLRRLGTDWIDLYQMHRWVPETDFEETLDALTDLVRQGKVRYIGSSTLPAPQIVEAQWAARERHLQRFVCEQPPYSMIVRGIEADVLPTCARHDVGVIAWSPLAAGWLSGKWRRASDHPESSRHQLQQTRFDMSLPENQAKLEAADALGALADELGVPLVQLALAFVLNHPAITSAIVGMRSVEQFESQLGALDLELNAATLDRIDAIVAPGTNVNPADTAWDNPALRPAARRR